MSAVEVAKHCGVVVSDSVGVMWYLSLLGNLFQCVNEGSFRRNWVICLSYNVFQVFVDESLFEYRRIRSWEVERSRPCSWFSLRVLRGDLQTVKSVLKLTKSWSEVPDMSTVSMV